MIPVLVQCTICESRINVKRLSDHICPLTQSNRFSQISCYDLELLPENNTSKEEKRLTLPELISVRRSSKCKAESKTQQAAPATCSRCHHDHATICIAKKFYHKKCLTCFVCRLPFSNSKSLKEFEGQIYCIKDYNTIITRPACPACCKTIESYVRPTVANGQLFHPEHIRCHQCQKPVDPNMTGLVERKGKFYCQTDFNDLYLPKCTSCNRVIEKEAIRSSDDKIKGYWHKECFQCQICNLPLLNKHFYRDNNAIYCKLHYYKIANLLCYICLKPIEGICGEILNGSKKVHPGCFTCHMCQCNIGDIYFTFKNKIYCENHKK